jgi:hypothetical protein
MNTKSRVVPAFLISGVVLAGGGAVLAAAGGSSSPGSAAKAQYCKNGGHGKKCKPKKPPKIHTHQRHRGRCYAKTFTMNVDVSNKPKGHVTRVYRDGHRIRSTRRNHFSVRTDVRALSPGVHRMKVRVRDADGHWVTRTVRFRRC